MVKARVLIVAADRGLVWALERELRDFELSITDGPAAALEALSPDLNVVIAEDEPVQGAAAMTLLWRVSVRCPAARRILISSRVHSREAEAYMSRALIHGFVRKPVRPGAVRILLETVLL